MAQVKISALPPASTLADDDETPFVDDSTTSTKKFTLAGLLAWLQSKAGWITTAMIGDNQVTAIKTAFGGNFTSAEVNTGFTWIDGKTIYKKTVNFGTLPNAGPKTTAHGISDFMMAVAVDGVVYDGTFSIILPQAHPTSINAISLYVDGTNVAMTTGSNRTSYTGYVTIYYIKT